jgi:tetratricopeptide (TPR) repeat protein
LRRRAAAGGRSERWHLGVADELRAQGANPGRIGWHMMEGGDPAGALEPLRKGANLALFAARWTRLESLTAQYRRALVALDLPQVDERWGVHQLLTLRGRLDRGPPSLDAALELIHLAEERGWVVTGYRAHVLAASLEERMGNVLAARARVEALAKVEAPSAGLHMRFLHRRACIAGQLGNGSDFAEWSRNALAFALSTGDRRMEQECRYVIAVEASHRGEHQAALVSLQGLRNARSTQADEVRYLNAIGSVLGREGRYREALPYFEQALSVVEAYGHIGVSTFRLNLALVLVRLSRLDEARQHLAAVEPGVVPWIGPAVQLVAAWVSLLVGEPAGALAQLERATEEARVLTHLPKLPAIQGEIRELAAGHPAVLRAVEALSALEADRPHRLV